jgi:hypothetical protein
MEVLTMYGVKVKVRRITDILREVRAYETGTAGSFDNDDDDDDDDDEGTDDTGSYSKLAAMKNRVKKFGSVPNLLAGAQLAFAASSPPRGAGRN